MFKTNPRFSHDNITNQRKFTGVHYHDDYELYYLVNGQTKYFIGDEIFKTDSEDCLYNERFLVGFKLDSIDGRTYTAIKELCEKRVVSVPRSRLDQLENVFLRLEAEYDGDKDKTLIDLYIAELVLKLGRCCVPHRQRLTEADMLIHEISRHISLNYSEDLSLDKLAFDFALSTSHLSRRFKAVAGIGINEYITYVRVLNAEKLLKTTKMPVTEVAAACGFNDSNYFSTVFKRIKGVTPLKFSKKFV